MSWPAHPMPCLRSLLYGAALVAAAALAPSAQAQTSVNGTIAYTVCEYPPGAFEIDCDIWTMNADGSNPVNLTNSPTTSEWGPVWSPDGTRIAFARGADYERDLWVMNADGGGQINITNDPGWQFGPSWSPGGTQIAYVKSVPGIVITSQFDIFVHDLATAQAANITRSDFDELEAAWSPDGTAIAISAVRITDIGWATWEIVTMSPTGENEQVLTAPPGRLQEDRAPAWSPDGSKIVFMSQFNDPCCETWEIWAMNRDGSGLTNLTQHPADDMFPSWSPDGTQILFSSTRDGSFGQLDLYTIPAPSVLPPPERRRAVAAARRLTTNGASSDADWGSKPHAIEGDFSLIVSLGKGGGAVGSLPRGIACGARCEAKYPLGTRVKIGARPDAGHRFAGWSGACAGQGNPCQVRIRDVTSVIARFKPLP